MESGRLTGQECSQLWEHSWCIYDRVKSALVAESPSLPLGRWRKTCISMWGNNGFLVSRTVSSTPVPLSHSCSISSQESVFTMNTSCPCRIHTPALGHPFHPIRHHRVSAPTIMHKNILFKARHAVISQIFAFASTYNRRVCACLDRTVHRSILLILEQKNT